jgi:hypothetical protein
MKTLNHELDRRRLLGHLGFAAVALPFFRLMQEEQLFGATPAKRALFFYFPDGIIKDRWHPTETGPNFTLPPMTAPLSIVKDDILMLRGVNSKATGSHEGGAAYSLTGTNGGGISLDTYLGEKLKSNSLLPVVRLGVGSNYQDGAKISYFAPGSAAPIQDNPTLAFMEIFGKSSTPLDSTAQAKLLAGEKSILDFCMNDIAGLQKKLGNIEKNKLDAHLESLRELERRIQGSAAGKPISTSCTKDVDMRGYSFPENDTNYPKAHHKNEAYAVIGDIMIDMMVQALACGVTNVGFLQWSRPVSPTVFDFPNGIAVARGHHDISHYGDLNGSGAADFIKAQEWYMTRLAELIKRLKNTKEGDQTMLQNTALMAFTEIADANLHDFNNVAMILAGQAGGNWKTGRVIDTMGASHNQVLVSMLQAFGLPGNSFGDASFGTGPIAGLA